MIKTTDLMLGNYVVCRVGGNDSDKRSIPMKVVALFDDCAYLDFDGNDGDVWDEYEKDLFGIEITEELLVNMGFEKTTKKRRGKVCTEYIKDDALVSRHNECQFFVTVSSSLTYVSQIEYLHQIQNAYHLLTGKDLEVKL